MGKRDDEVRSGRSVDDLDDDAPELTDEELAQFRPLRDFQELYRAIMGRDPPDKDGETPKEPA